VDFGKRREITGFAPLTRVTVCAIVAASFGATGIQGGTEPVPLIARDGAGSADGGEIELFVGTAPEIHRLEA